MTNVLLIAVALVMIVYALTRHRNGRVSPQEAKRALAQSKLAKQAKVHGKYHCVTVQCGGNACAKVGELRGKSLLPNQAPALPLVGCNASTCQCHYAHHEDRRLMNRRDAYGEFSNVTIAAVNHAPRARRDRRRAPSSAQYA